MDLNEIAGAADGAARKNGKRYLMVIRSATKQDLSALLDVEKQAFEKKEGPVIADLVTQLLQDPGARPLLSLLAVDRNQAVGHILFTNTCIHGTEDPVSASILAPLAVIPHAQSKGIGGLLVDEGLKRQSESGVDLVFVDYLQLMTYSGRASNRNEQITEMSRSIKALARELEIPVVCAAQLNRGPTDRPTHRPRMSDLRESGSIEQDADVVSLLHCEDYYHRGEADYVPKNITELIIAKQRNGPTGIVYLTFRADITRFESAAPDSHAGMDGGF